MSNNATNTSNPVSVAHGGSGDSSFTAYSIICGGTTSTGVLQSVSGVGTTNQILMSNGSSALPSWQSGGMKLISTQTVTTATGALVFSSIPVSSFTNYWVNIADVTNSSSAAGTYFQVLMGTGSTYLSTYYAGNNSNPYNSATLTNTSTGTTCLLTPSLSTGSAHLAGYLAFTIPTNNVAQYTGQLFLTLSTSDYINCFGCNVTNSVNALQFSYTNGNISSGYISLYGIVQ
jgi:hypothetical protein